MTTINAQPFTVNIAEIMKSTTVNPFVKVVASMVQRNPYLTVGECFSAFSAEELDCLSDYASDVYSYLETPGAALTACEEGYQMLTLITSLLMAAESTINLTPEAVNESMRATMVFVGLEELYRDGVIEVDHNSWAYGDNDHKVIARKCNDTNM